MLKPLSKWEGVLWVALPVIVVGAVVAAVVQGNGAASWILAIAAAFALANLLESRRRSRDSKTPPDA